MSGYERTVSVEVVVQVGGEIVSDRVFAGDSCPECGETVLDGWGWCPKCGCILPDGRE